MCEACARLGMKRPPLRRFTRRTAKSGCLHSGVVTCVLRDAEGGAVGLLQKEQYHIWASSSVVTLAERPHRVSWRRVASVHEQARVSV
eukprot:163534-Rhodomonas_salina.1